MSSLSQNRSENVEDVLKSMDLLTEESFKGDEAGRSRALRKARSLCGRLETGWDYVLQKAWFEPSILAAIKVSQDLKLFDNVPSPPARGVSLETLASATKCSPGLLRRILRVLTAETVLDEPSPDCYLANPSTRKFLHPGVASGISVLHDIGYSIFSQIPDHLHRVGYVELTDKKQSIAHTFVPSDLTFFDWMRQRPKLAADFDKTMALMHSTIQASWVNTYPLKRLTEGITVKDDLPLVVDVGGGHGRDMENVRQVLLPASYKLLVQDSATTVDEGRKTAHHNVQFQAHDFFSPQPVRGARAYAMHRIMHDWPDTQARQILAQLKDAMTPGYSKLLIIDNVVPDYGAPMTLDLGMMALFSAKERTESDWRELLSSVGLSITGIWRGENANGDGVVEVEVPLAPTGQESNCN